MTTQRDQTLAGCLRLIAIRDAKALEHDAAWMDDEGASQARRRIDELCEYADELESRAGEDGRLGATLYLQGYTKTIGEEI